jgi:hypothetical protein
MAEVSDGGLQLQIDAPAPEVIFSGANCNDLSSYRTYMQDSYNQAGHNFAAITNSLKNSLEGQERFFLPVGPQLHLPVMVLICARLLVPIFSRTPSSIIKARCSANLSTTGKPSEKSLGICCSGVDLAI